MDITVDNQYIKLSMRTFESSIRNQIRKRWGKITERDSDFNVLNVYFPDCAFWTQNSKNP